MNWCQEYSYHLAFFHVHTKDEIRVKANNYLRWSPLCSQQRKSNKLIQMATVVSTVIQPMSCWAISYEDSYEEWPHSSSNGCWGEILNYHHWFQPGCSLREALLRSLWYTNMVLRITVRTFYLIWETMSICTWESKVCSILICPSTKTNRHYVRHIPLSVHSQFWPQHSITQPAPYSLVYLVAFSSRFCLQLI